MAHQRPFMIHRFITKSENIPSQTTLMLLMIMCSLSATVYLATVSEGHAQGPTHAVTVSGDPRIHTVDHTGRTL